MGLAAYESPWINSSKRVKNALRLLMVRCQKPLVFHAWFYPMDLSVFIMVCIFIHDLYIAYLLTKMLIHFRYYELLIVLTTLCDNLMTNCLFEENVIIINEGLKSYIE